MFDKLEQYAKIKKQADELAAQVRQIEADIEAEMRATGARLTQMDTPNGWVRASFKAGQSTDHEAAYKAKIAECVEHEMHSTAATLSGIVKKHTVIKETTAWAKVTKELAIDVEPFTKQGEPTFVIEVM